MFPVVAVAFDILQNISLVCMTLQCFYRSLLFVVLLLTVLTIIIKSWFCLSFSVAAFCWGILKIFSVVAQIFCASILSVCFVLENIRFNSVIFFRHNYCTQKSYFVLWMFFCEFYGFANFINIYIKSFKFCCCSYPNEK